MNPPCSPAPFSGGPVGSGKRQFRLAISLAAWAYLLSLDSLTA